MKFRFLIPIIFLAAVAHSAAPPQIQGPLSGNQVMVLVKAGMDAPAVVKLIQEHGINFDLTDDYLEALRKAGAQEEVIQALRATHPKPLSSDQVLALLAGGVPSKRAAILVKEHGIDFVADKEYLDALRLAGANDELIAALRETSDVVTVDLVVVTSPGAAVYLNGAPQGKVGAQGELTLKASLGTCTLKVSLEGKKDFERNVVLVAQQTTRIEAQLEDINPPELSKPNATPIDWATQAIPWRGRNGERFAVTCPPGGILSRTLWGTGLYTDDSSICVAAVHAGLITPQQGGEGIGKRRW